MNGTWQDENFIQILETEFEFMSAKKDKSLIMDFVRKLYEKLNIPTEVLLGS